MRSTIPVTAILALAGGLCFAGSADKNGNYVDPINNLAKTQVDTVTVGLTWSAPAGHNIYDASYYYGPADSYELRYSTTLSGASNWTTMIPAIADLPGPGQPYNPDTDQEADVQATTVQGLTQKTEYWFVMKVIFRGTSDYSKIVQVTTAVDTVAPAAITGLTVTGVSDETVTLAWTATGDDNGTGTATRTELRYSTTGPILTSNDFDSATPVTSMPEPQADGASEAKVVGGLAATTTYWFSIRAVDEVGNKGALAQVNATTMTPDPGSGGKGGGCAGSAPGSTLLLGAAILLAALPLARR